MFKFVGFQFEMDLQMVSLKTEKKTFVLGKRNIISDLLQIESQARFHAVWGIYIYTNIF